MKISNIKIFIALIAAIFAIFTPAPISSQSTNCGTSAVFRSTGLVSTPAISGVFSTNGACQVDNARAPFVPYKIPTYDDLKSRYFNQSKTSNKSTLTNWPSSFNGNAAYEVNGPLTVDQTPTGNGAIVIFVSGALSITADYTYGGNSSSDGTVFVVQGDVDISPTVVQINAVIISSGTIYTASSDCTTNTGNPSDPGTPNNQLTINGSLISIYQSQTQADACALDSINNTCPEITFCRFLNDNNQPAEKINHDPKYLVILRDLYADTAQNWSEIP